MDAGVEHVEILGAECRDVAGGISSHLGDEGIEVVGVLLVHVVGHAQVFMAESGELGIIGKIVDAEPPGTEHGSHERSYNATDVDEHVENLESGVAFGSPARIVVELAHDGLEVALEQTVAERDEEERAACEGEQPGGVFGCGENRHCKHYVAKGHYYQTADDGAFVVLCLVGYDTADEAQNVDSGIEE